MENTMSSSYKCKLMMQINNQRTNKMLFFPNVRMCFWMYFLGFMCIAQLPAANSMDTTTGNNGLNCTIVRPVFEARGINPIDLPKEPINEMVLRYCEMPRSGTCCTYNVETKLAGASRMQLEKHTKESIGKLATVLGARATKFNDFFKELLAQSKKEFHEMFKRTYGVIYEQNSYVFSDLFNQLENYYTRGKVDLAEELDTFFNILYQKMFTVLNSQYTFDDKYLGCVSEHMKELKPFGDVPDKLSVQIKRSFVATRTYEQALAAAAEVARNMMNVRPNADCTAALTKMHQCGACKGFIEKPCSNYCVNVMKGCLHYYNEMDIEWDNFVASMEKVSERLLGPFNIVMVVEPINIKISEAIMNFQETGQDISQQVFQGCGRPQLGRRKRSTNPKFFQLDEKQSINDTIIKLSSSTTTTTTTTTTTMKPVELVDNNFVFDENPMMDGGDEELLLNRNIRAAEPANRELQYEPLQFSNSDEVVEHDKNDLRKNRKKQKQINNGKKKNSDEEPHMDKLVKDIRQKVKDSKKFWSNLPFQICNHEEFSAPPSVDANCWNGNTVDRYPHSIVNEIQANPEFPSTATNAMRQSSIVAGQLFTLKNAVGHLRNAYNGMDVEWTDVDEPYYGSGSGSGAGIDDEDDDTGSGLSPYVYHPRIPDHTDINKIDTNTNNAIGGGVGGGGTSVNSNNGGDSTLSTNGGDSRHHPTVTDDNNSSSNNIDGDSNSNSGSTNKLPQMSLRRALLTYLFPIYMAWFGGIFCDLL